MSATSNRNIAAIQHACCLLLRQHPGINPDAACVFIALYHLLYEHSGCALQDPLRTREVRNFGAFRFLSGKDQNMFHHSAAHPSSSWACFVNDNSICCMPLRCLCRCPGVLDGSRPSFMHRMFPWEYLCSGGAGIQQM